MQIATNLTEPNLFPFTLAHDSTFTSGGIFSNGNLIRTLWSNIPYKAGTHSIKWDGKDDDGNLMAVGNYNLVVHSNNNVIAYKGKIGNNSTNLSGTSVWRGGTLPVDMVEIGSAMYCAMAFSEGSTSQCKFLKSNPHEKVEYHQQALTYQGSYFVCANGIYRIFGGKDYTGNTNFVYPELVSNDSITTFSAGSTFKPSNGVTYNGAIDINNLGNIGAVTGMAIQHSGNGYLFISHKNQNTINVYRTSDGSGSFIRSISITSPTNLELEGDGTLWVSQGTTVSKFTVNSDGSLTLAGSIITGLTRVAGLSILSGDLILIDASNRSSIKRYNSTTLSLTQSIGYPSEGYDICPVVRNNKFYLEDPTGQLLTFIRHESSGGFWFSDSGNFRILHYDNTGTLIEQISYVPIYNSYNDGTNIGATYNVNLCYNQSNSVFLNFLEFIIDTTQNPFTWTLSNNWSYNYPTGWNQGNPVEAVALLGNGRRYMHVLQKNTTNNYIAELTSTGLRINTTKIYAPFSSLGRDGNLTTTTTGGITSSPIVAYNKYNLTGFDGSNNPIYSSVVNGVPMSLGKNYPIPVQRDYNITSSGKVILFDNGISLPRSGNFPIYHLAGFDSTTHLPNFKTHKATFPAYTGILPEDGTYDIGNSVQRPGGGVVVVGDDIITNYHGEFWKNLQTGVFYHWNENGLLKGKAGLTGAEVVGQVAPYSYFTNALSSNACIINNEIWCFFNDEAAGAGIAVWNIGNRASEINQTIPITLINRVSPFTNLGIDLLVHVPDNQSSLHGVTGFSQVPSADVKVGSNQFYTTSRKNTYNFSESPDFCITCSGVGNYQLKEILTPATNIANWTIEGELVLQYNTMKGNEGSGNKVYIEILDRNNKVISRIYFYTTNRIQFNGTYYGPFNNTKYRYSPFILKRIGSNIFLSINMWGQVLTATLPMYDLTADASNPLSISWNFNFITANFGYIGVNKLKFI